MISILAFLFVFTIVVLIHEFGHFIAARKTGINVYEFSIGFPFSPKIATLFRHKETEFTLRLLPLGGFVSFSRNEDESETIEFLKEDRWKKRCNIIKYKNNRNSDHRHCSTYLQSLFRQRLYGQPFGTYWHCCYGWEGG